MLYLPPKLNGWIRKTTFNFIHLFWVSLKWSTLIKQRCLGLFIAMPPIFSAPAYLLIKWDFNRTLLLTFRKKKDLDLFTCSSRYWTWSLPFPSLENIREVKIPIPSTLPFLLWSILNRKTLYYLLFVPV